MQKSNRPFFDSASALIEASKSNLFLPPETIRRNDLLDFAWDVRFRYPIAGDPNPRQDGAAFAMELVEHLEKHGIAFLWKYYATLLGGVLREIYLLDPYATAVVHLPTGGDVYRVRDFGYKGHNVDLPSTQVDVIRLPDTLRLGAKQPSSETPYRDLERYQLRQLVIEAIAKSGVSTEHPNPYDTCSGLIEKSVKELETTGVCYLWKHFLDEGKLGELRFPHLEVIPTKQLTLRPRSFGVDVEYYQWWQNPEDTMRYLAIDVQEVTKLTNPYFSPNLTVTEAQPPS